MTIIWFQITTEFWKEKEKIKKKKRIWNKKYFYINKFEYLWKNEILLYVYNLPNVLFIQYIYKHILDFSFCSIVVHKKYYWSFTIHCSKSHQYNLRTILNPETLKELIYIYVTKNNQNKTRNYHLKPVSIKNVIFMISLEILYNYAQCCRNTFNKYILIFTSMY